MELTAQQRKALTLLVATGPANFPHQTFPPGGGWDTGVAGFYKTGLNTQVLSSLLELGLIACKRIYLRGSVSDDLTITAEGLALAASFAPVDPVAELRAKRSAAGRKAAATRSRLLAEAAHRPAPFTS